MSMLGRKVFLRVGLSAVAGFLLAALLQSPARAAGPVPSLDIVPADAAFYSVMLRNREQIEAIVQSKAFAKVKALPYVQMGLGMYKIQAADPKTPLGQFEAARQNPAVKRVLALLADMFSNEVFVYGGPGFNELIELMQGVYGDVYWQATMAAMKSPGQPRQMEELQGRALVRALTSRIDLIKFPELIIGFKVNDKELAKEQLDRLEFILQMVLTQAPPLQNRLKRTDVDKHSYLTLTLDGAMVPWDPRVVEKIRSLAETPEDGDKLIERLKKTTLVISLGLRDDYLLLAISPSTDTLAKLGKGKLLGSLPELAAVAKFADKRICSVGYLSKSLHRHVGQSKGDIDNLLALGKRVLPSLPVPEELREKIANDACELAKDVKPLIPEVGAMASIAFFTDSGLEGYEYDWSEHPELDSSKPLDLLKHVGGSPIAAIVQRSKASPEGYDLLVKWIGIGYRYVEEYGLPKLEAKERAEFDKVFAKVKPLLGRLDKTTRDLLIPALADGQAGLAIDAKFTSRQFIKALPATEKPMPMLEPAIIIGVSDAAKLKQAFSEYYAVADDFVDVLKGLEKSDVPKDFKIPRPEVRTTRQGTVYGYRLPAEWGVDGRVYPNAGLSANVAVLSLSRGHSQRLLGAKDAKIAGFTLPTDRPLACAGGLDFAAFVDAVTPWVELAIDKAQLSTQEAEMARQHAKTALEVLKVLRGSVSESYVEGDVNVTHTRTEFRDIDE
jgi:hypothetical protein